MKEPAPSSCPITPIPKNIGPYTILKKIASGGMGEVFLAYDPFCKRNLALKQIRSDKLELDGLKDRFLKEVKIAAQLSHPGIIPIYQIHQTEKEVYYTMPLVEGETLKEIIKTTYFEEKEGLAKHPIGSSIPALMRIFLSICQAVAYAHSKGILHRDLKPENIIIGPYGEVLILDWGLADFANNPQEEISLPEDDKEGCNLTKPGKIAGTLSYLPPERFFGAKASYTSDIYALGVILYQLLTLRAPFHRKSVKECKKYVKKETFTDPSEKAPYRDIPPQLSKIAKKCLANRPEKRYMRVEEIITDLTNYIKGHAQWIPHASIQIEHKPDWKFQENILLAKHIALTQKSDVMEWVSLMIAKGSFPERVKLETHVRIKEGGKGLGFLLNLGPTEEGKDFFQEGFFIWIGSEKNPGSHLFRSNVELMSNPDLYLKNQLSHFLRIEKTDHHIKLYVDDLLAFDYLSHAPFNGPHFGLVFKDDDLEVGAILVSTSSPNILINCLAVPDTLLTLRHFKEALSKYRQIASSFAGRPEGKEALFRAGITLLEEALVKKSKKQKLLEQALEEFDKLRVDGGSPLEYLGKSLVYKALQDLDEETKCLELSLRRFAKHPLIHLVKDQVLFRLHEASYKDKAAAYAFALLTLRLISEAFTKQDNKKLLKHLYKNCEEPDFFNTPLQDTPFHLTIKLAFWLHKPMLLAELFSLSLDSDEKEKILCCLAYLGEHDLVGTLDPLFKEKNPVYLCSQFYLLHASKQKPLLETIDSLTKLDLSLQRHQIAFNLFLGNFEKADSLLKNHDADQESSPFYFLKGCYIASQEGFAKGKDFLSRRSERILPPVTCLIDYFLEGELAWKKSWEKKALFWEKIQLQEQLTLFYHCASLEQKYKESLKELRKLLL